MLSQHRFWLASPGHPIFIEATVTLDLPDTHELAVFDMSGDDVPQAKLLFIRSKTEHRPGHSYTGSQDGTGYVHDDDCPACEAELKEKADANPDRPA